MYKKLISLFAFFLLACGVAIAAEPTYESWTDKSQYAARQGTAVRVLKRVRYVSRDANSTSLVSGDAASYSVISDDGVSVTRPTVSADGSFAGIIVTTIQTADSDSVVAQDDAGERNWGYMIVHGPASANMTAGGGNGCGTGDIFITSVDESNVTTLQFTAAGTAATVAHVNTAVRGKGGFFMDACDGTATVIDVFVEKE